MTSLSMRCLAASAIGVVLFASTACTRSASAPIATEVQPYRAYLASPSGEEIPFFLELPVNCNTNHAAVVNGTERIPVACQRFGSRLLLEFPVYGTRIAAETGEGGLLAGQWSHSGGGLRDRMRFGARPLPAVDPRERFPSTSGASTGLAPEAGSPSGVWRITFSKHGLAKGMFTEVAPGIVHGTAEVVSEYGDLRFMAGNIRGPELWLSTFDGSKAYMLRGRVGADGKMHGEFISADGTRDTFVAERSADFDLSDPLQQVRVVSSTRRVDYALLRSPRYADKAVILELFGTWCSNCNDLAGLLNELHREHRDQGLEIISLAYEVSQDEAYNRDRLNAYKAKYGHAWQTLLADGLPKDLLAPAELTRMDGVPVTVFLNRDRTIHAIYTGFWGPATGVTHRKTVETFRRLTREIVASR